MSAFILDTASLNALYKINRKIVAILNYIDGTDRLLTDINSLPAGSTVYLVMLPLPEDEGDFELETLSHPNRPFMVNSKEMVVLHDAIANVPNAGDIFVVSYFDAVNSLSNHHTYYSQIKYGNRYALYSVKNGEVDSLTVFNTKQDVIQACKDKSNVYGENTLVDQNIILSRYHELEGISLPDLQAISPLIGSDTLQSRVNLRDIVEQCRIKALGKPQPYYDKIDDIEPNGEDTQDIQFNQPNGDLSQSNREINSINHEPSTQNEENDTHEEQATDLQSNYSEVEDVENHSNRGIGSIPAIALGLVSSFLIGCGIYLNGLPVTLKSIEEQNNSTLQQSSVYTEMARSFETSIDKCSNIINVIEIAKTGGATISKITYDSTGLQLVVTLTGMDKVTSFAEFIGSKVLVSSFDVVGQEQTNSGEMYSVIFYISEM